MSLLQEPDIHMESLIQSAVSKEDILQKVHTKVHSYSDLMTLDSIDDIFDSKGRCIILYANEDINTGHWVALCRQTNCIQFYDSYGYPPDFTGISTGASKQLEKITGQSERRLLYLIRNSGYGIEYSNECIQNEEDSATCGKYCVLKLLFNEMPISLFNRFIESSSAKYNLSNDEYISLVYELL